MNDKLQRIIVWFFVRESEAEWGTECFCRFCNSNSMDMNEHNRYCPTGWLYGRDPKNEI